MRREIEWADEYTWEYTPGVCVACLDTGQVWDASHWTRQDWDDFREPGHDRLAQVEQMTGYPSWEALRDGVTA